MFPQHKWYHLLFPTLSILLVVLPSFVQNNELNSYPNEYQKQLRKRQTVADSSVSSSDVSFDTKNFDNDDSVPSAFNWDSPGVSSVCFVFKLKKNIKYNENILKLSDVIKSSNPRYSVHQTMM